MRFWTNLNAKNDPHRQPNGKLLDNKTRLAIVKAKPVPFFMATS